MTDPLAAGGPAVTPPSGRPSARALAGVYRAGFTTAVANQLAYRGATAIWLFATVIQPIVSIVVWRTISGPGGTIGGYTAGQFTTYFTVMMLVDHLTFVWVMWEMEWRIRTGAFSPLLLRPVHPIHADVCSNLSYKVIGLVAIVPAMIIVMIGFGADGSGIDLVTVLAFVPALILAMVLRFLMEWTLALAAFWLTKVSAVNNLYFSVTLFLGGAFAPLSVLPPLIGTIATWSPFPWCQAFVVNVLMGRVSGTGILTGYAVQLVWIAVAAAVLALVWRRATATYTAVGA